MSRWNTGRRGRYGVDSPFVPAAQVGLAVLLVQFGIGAVGDGRPIGWLPIAVAIGLALVTSVYLHASRRGKVRGWSRALDELGFRGDEQVLDIGCGRGTVLTLAAQRVPDGRVVGVDNWKKTSGLVSRPGDAERNNARRNAAAEGVADRVHLASADMRELPIAADTFDVVTAGLAISSHSRHEDRMRSVDEAVRVLKPGGVFVVADIRCTREVAARLVTCDMLDVGRESWGWQGWYGGPWAGTHILSARKPPR